MVDECRPKAGELRTESKTRKKRADGTPRPKPPKFTVTLSGKKYHLSIERAFSLTHQLAMVPESSQHFGQLPEGEWVHFINAVSRRNVSLCVELILQQSHAIKQLVRGGRLAVIGAIYDVVTRQIDFFPDTNCSADRSADRSADDTSRGPM